MGEAADSLIFIFVAFAGNLPFQVLIGMVLTQAILKTIYEIIILPITILVVKWVKRVEGADTYDVEVSYNPFLINQV